MSDWQAPRMRQERIVPPGLLHTRDIPGIMSSAWNEMNTLQKVGLLPVVGDIAGFGGDIQEMIEKPESRTLANGLLAGAGLLPFVPASLGTLKSITRKVNFKGLGGYNTSSEITGTNPLTRSTYVVTNPNEAALYRLSGRDKKDLRIFVDSKGDLHSWVAEDAIHRQIADALGRDISIEASDSMFSPDSVYPYLQDIYKQIKADDLEFPEYDSFVPKGIKVLDE